MLWPFLFLGAAAWWMMQPRNPSTSPNLPSGGDAEVSGPPPAWWRRNAQNAQRRRAAANRARQAAAALPRPRPFARARPGLVVVQPAPLPMPPMPAAWARSPQTAAADCASVPPLALRDQPPQVLAWWLSCPGRSIDEAELLLGILLNAGRERAAEAVVEMLGA